MGWAEDFLAEVEANPEISIVEAARRIGLAVNLLHQRRRARQDVMEREAEIRSAHRGRQRLEAIDQREGRGAEDDLEADLPPHLELFLEIFRETRKRVATVRIMREVHGYDTTWAEVMEAMAEYPNFRRVFGELFDEDVAEVEDEVRELAKTDLRAARIVLQAERPEKYGRRVSVDVKHTHRLEPQHRQLVEGIKREYIAAPRARKAEPETVEGEFEVVTAQAET